MARITFRDKEKERYIKVKSKILSQGAQQEGNFRGRPRPFCIADDYSCENLYEGVRQSAIEYFNARNIKWHDGLQERRLPSNHLCCSQSCCVNFLYPMTNDSNLLIAIFKNYYPDMIEPLTMIEDKSTQQQFQSLPYLSFEWIGVRDYIGENIRKPGIRTRGANYTSADFAFRFLEKGGKIHLILGEWKYTEEYGRSDKGRGRSGVVRKNNYIDFFKKKGGVFNTNPDINLYNALFYEPFYQLMRLQLLAQEMEVCEKKEMGADVVSVLHISPKSNSEFRERVTSPHLEDIFPGKDVMEIWSNLVSKGKFMSVSVEDLLNEIDKCSMSNREWADYLETRYKWESQ